MFPCQEFCARASCPVFSNRLGQRGSSTMVDIKTQASNQDEYPHTGHKKDVIAHFNGTDINDENDVVLTQIFTVDLSFSLSIDLSFSLVLSLAPFLSPSLFFSFSFSLSFSLVLLPSPRAFAVSLDLIQSFRVLFQSRFVACSFSFTLACAPGANTHSLPVPLSLP